ncbi:MAG: hypothetical protein ACPGWR_27150 [Ardenticatenaceae bacterium]
MFYLKSRDACSTYEQAGMRVLALRTSRDACSTKKKGCPLGHGMLVLPNVLKI